MTALSLAQQRGPKAFSPEPSFNMGYIPQRAKFGHRFWVYNIGTDSLNIRNVQVSCGCTKASSAVGMVAVNDSVPIDIVFDSGTRRLTQDKRVTVRTNDPGAGNLSLQFTAYVFTPAQEDTIGPVNFTQNKKLNATTDDLGKTFVIEYRNHSKEAVKPTLIREPDDLVASVEIPDEPVKPGGIGKITVALVKSVTDKNQHKSITVQFDDTHKSRYTIPVRLAESISSLKDKS
jgi:hypothetical protein